MVAIRYSAGLFLLIGLLATEVLAGSPALFPGVWHDANNYPCSVQIADLDRDGIKDVVVANRDSDTVSVLRGLGDGAFADPVPYTMGMRPQSVVTADVDDDGVDSDGIVDLVVTNLHSTSMDDVVILRGVGDGVFSVAGRYPFARVGPVAVGDLNADGVLDVAVGDDDTVHVLLGLGDASFAAPVAYTADDGVDSVAIGDLDGNGTLDLVTANGVAQTVTALFGFGDGSFGAPVICFSDYGVGQVAVADMNGDGLLDLVVAGGTRVSVLLGTGDGTFSPSIQHEVSPCAGSVAIADLNGDGVLELAVTCTDGAMSTLLGTGTGAFVEGESRVLPSAPTSVASGDLDRDGREDLVITITSFGSLNEKTGTLVLGGHGDGTFASPVFHSSVDSPYGSATQAVVQDLDNDGWLDVAVTTWDLSSPARGNVDVLLNQRTLPGDCDCNGQVDFVDIQAFLTALGGPQAYYAGHPYCDWRSADCDEDGDVDFFDIDAFLERLGS